MARWNVRFDRACREGLQRGRVEGAMTKEAGEKAGRPQPYQSAMEHHPEMVRAIGMVSIEIANLDVMMAELLAALLNKPSDLGHVIYHAPRGERVRLDIVEAVVKEMFQDEEAMSPGAKVLKQQLLHWIKRARGLVDKRHEVMHSNWGMNPGTLEVLRSRQPMRQGQQVPVELKDLARIIEDTRTLITEIHGATAQVHTAIYPPPPEKS